MIALLLLVLAAGVLVLRRRGGSPPGVAGVLIALAIASGSGMIADNAIAQSDCDPDDVVDGIWDIGPAFDCTASVVNPPHLSSTGGKARARGRFECTEPVVQGAVIKVTVCLSVRQGGAWTGMGCETKSRQDGARQVERSIGRPCIVGQVRRYRVRVRGEAIDIVGDRIPGSFDRAEPEEGEFFCPGSNNPTADGIEYGTDALE